ncbi:MAG: type ISP restriction/modification enzyme, partial [Armatimonadota bacterium]
MTIKDYIKSLNQYYKAGNASEHTYRGVLEQLISAICPRVRVTNEPKRIDCGAPDYIITKSNIPIGYIEAKDIGTNLNDKRHKEQFDRYKSSLDNLIITDYLTFELYISGEFVLRVSIAEVQGNKIVEKPENFDIFTDFISNFCIYEGQTIKTSQKLAKMMARKAKILADIVEKAVTDDKEQQKTTDLYDQMLALEKVLIKDITPSDFADIYSQTIAYGMFVARLHDASIANFTRQEAANLIPKSNPFLRQLFVHIAGYDLDSRIDWVIDALADLFKATDVDEILKEFDKFNQDPVIHFYETFLAEYNPALRKSRGVYYTPDPVVKFIVRAVDDVLKTEFNISNGLADTSKTRIKVVKKGNVAGEDEIVEQEVHKVQILDPAAGTGTFLAEVVSKIYESFVGQEGLWSAYVDEHLIPRLNGFELLMASYAMAHLKLDLVLNKTGYKPTRDQERFRVYLTNSLEDHYKSTDTMFARWLSEEANGANSIKRDTPVMVVLGNPPYSVSSSNKSKWINDLMEDYKRDLNERNINPLSDDYLKFIRYGEYFIEKNGDGVLAFITNNSFIDGVIHRQMRKHLLETFDKLYILNLHGDSRKKEVCPDGSKDENVFDIQQGVSISIFIKMNQKKKNKFASILRYDLYGSRIDKYEFLKDNKIESIEWNSINIFEPEFFFKHNDKTIRDEYSNFFSLNSLFVLSSTGIKTHRDDFVFSYEKKTLEKRISDFCNLDISDNEIMNLYQLSESNDWKIKEKRISLVSDKNKFDYITKCIYRPFDIRYYFNNPNLVNRTREEVMKHYLISKNIGLISARHKETLSSTHWEKAFITNSL